VLIVNPSQSPAEKLSAMRKDAEFEVADDGDAEGTALAAARKIKGSSPAMTAQKVFLSNRCVFNCAYCGCRCGREDRRDYALEPRELACLAVSTAKANGMSVFITSAIDRDPDYTQERIAETVRIMRQELGYSGYLHAKVMPGADPGLIAKTGIYAGRLSVNIEVANSAGYDRIAKQKHRSTILTPMGEIALQIRSAKENRRHFAISQTTQLMAGSTGEDDRTIIRLASALYKKYALKRVYYTPFKYEIDAKGYEAEQLPHVATPYWRMARLYQADRLLELYGFTADDIAPEDAPYLEEDIDPKAAWALRHLGSFPVEVNTADYETLLRVPGIGLTYAKRILETRKYCAVTHDILRKMRVSLKRCRYFITCSGKYDAGDGSFSYFGAFDPLSSAHFRDFLVTKTAEKSISQSLEDGCGA